MTVKKTSAITTVQLDLFVRHMSECVVSRLPEWLLMLTISETFNKLNQSEVTAGEGGKGLKELSVKSLS